MKNKEKMIDITLSTEEITVMYFHIHKIFITEKLYKKEYDDILKKYKDNKKIEKKQGDITDKKLSLKHEDDQTVTFLLSMKATIKLLIKAAEHRILIKFPKLPDNDSFVYPENYNDKVLKSVITKLSKVIESSM